MKNKNKKQVNQQKLESKHKGGCCLAVALGRSQRANRQREVGVGHRDQQGFAKDLHHDCKKSSHPA
jgi:hypothetical protein